jgi:hypothetical protein
VLTFWITLALAVVGYALVAWLVSPTVRRTLRGWRRR